MKKIYSGSGRLVRKLSLVFAFMVVMITAHAQLPTLTGPGICTGVVANFNTNDNGYNSPSVYAGILDSAFYFHSGRGYWTDYLPPYRTQAPGFPRVQNIISPPYNNPNPVGTFNVGFYYIVNNPTVDQFVIRIISITQTPMGTIDNVEASTGVKRFSDWSTPTPYIDGTTPPIPPDPTPLMGSWQGNVCIRLIDPDITNAPNVTYRVEVTYLLNSPTFAVFDNVSIGPELIPTPVYFIGLVANRNTDQSVGLRWDVTEEVDVREYQVERSTGTIGSGFSRIGTVAAKGKSIYNFTDNTAPNSTVFYRIKSVDNNGSTRYSGILRLKGNASSSYGDQLKVYPSPARDNITIEHARTTRDARITVTGVDGKIMRTMTPANGASHTMINLNGMTPGMYIVRMDDGMGNIQTMKFIKE